MITKGSAKHAPSNKTGTEIRDCDKVDDDDCTPGELARIYARIEMSITKHLCHHHEDDLSPGHLKAMSNFTPVSDPFITIFRY